MIPNIIHFIYGLEPDFGNKNFCLVHYLAIKSAIEVNSPEKVFLYVSYEPQQNVWWNKVKKMVKVEKVTPPQSIYNNTLHHVAHKADVLRLQKLIKKGGIYLDIDTICVESFHSLRKHSFVMGLEKSKTSIVGLCNAVMMAEPQAEFLHAWLETYKSFRSRGQDKYWAEHSVCIPYKLASEEPALKSEIHVEPHTSFLIHIIPRKT